MEFIMSFVQILKHAAAVEEGHQPQKYSRKRERDSDKLIVMHISYFCSSLPPPEKNFYIRMPDSGK